MDEKEYLKLLRKAKQELPDVNEAASRLKVPKVEAIVEGNKTIIRNITQIAKVLNRDPEHLLKYFMKKYATPGVLKDRFGILGRRVNVKELDMVLNQYIEDFVICPVCKSPDTEIVAKGAYGTLVCKACGSKTPIKVKI